MPCYQVRTTTLEAPAANIETMAAALRMLGFAAAVREQDRTIRLMTQAGISGYWADGRIVMYGRVRVDENAVRRAYLEATRRRFK